MCLGQFAQTRHRNLIPQASLHLCTLHIFLLKVQDSCCFLKLEQANRPTSAQKVFKMLSPSIADVNFNIFAIFVSLGACVSGHDDSPGDHPSANAANSPATSFVSTATSSTSPAAASSYVTAGNVGCSLEQLAQLRHIPKHEECYMWLMYSTILFLFFFFGTLYAHGVNICATLSSLKAAVGKSQFFCFKYSTSDNRNGKCSVNREQINI